jgi:hypothetical protein
MVTIHAQFAVAADGDILHLTCGASETKFTATTRREAEDQVREFVQDQVEHITQALVHEANRQR